MEGHQKFLGGGGGVVLKAKFLEAKYEAKLKFPGGRWLQTKKPSVGGVWIFSGTAQYLNQLLDLIAPNPNTSILNLATLSCL